MFRAQSHHSLRFQNRLQTLTLILATLFFVSAFRLDTAHAQRVTQVPQTNVPTEEIQEPINVVLSDADREQALSESLVSEEFQSKLDYLTESDRYPHFDTQMLMNGMMSYPVRYALIARAKKSITLVTFSIYAKGSGTRIADTISAKMVEMLIAAKNRNVDVKVMVDGGTSVLAQSQPAIDALRAAGIQVIKYNPIVSDTDDLPLLLSGFHALARGLGDESPLENRWHEKTLIVDSEYLLTGGLNWGELYAFGNTFTAHSYNASEFFTQPLLQQIGVAPQNTWGRIDGSAWRDTDAVTYGPVAAAAQKQLLKDFAVIDMANRDASVDDYKNYTRAIYNKATAQVDQLIANDERYAALRDVETKKINQTVGSIRYITQRPFMDAELDDPKQLESYAKKNQLWFSKKHPERRMSNFYLNAIEQAKRQILWGCHSNRPTEEILDALSRAAQRGVKVYIIGNSREAAEHLPEYGLMMYPLAHDHYKPFIRAGRTKGGEDNIRVFEWSGSVRKDGQLLESGAFHSKIFSVDGVLTVVGSFNISKASFKLHTEGAIAILDPEFARSAEEMFTTDLTFTREVKEHLIFDLDHERYNFGNINKRRRP